MFMFYLQKWWSKGVSKVCHTDFFILLCFILLPQNCLETFGKMLSCQDLDEKIDTTLMLAVAVNTQL